MDKELGKDVVQGTEIISVNGNEAAETQVINCDGMPAAVMINKKRVRGNNENGDGVSGDEGDRPTRRYRTRSMVWEHCTKLPVVSHKPREAECNYCKKIFPCDMVKNGTSHMKHHLEYKCPLASEHIKKTDPLQKLLGFGSGGVSCTAYNAESSRKALSEMIILDELPYRFVEGDGFRKLCAALQPRFSVPSRKTIARDCMKLFNVEKAALKTSLIGKRLCITTDTWTSIQNVNYMSLTGHYIDSDWHLHKKILNFCLVESHKGPALGKAIESCLLEWGISSLFTVTVDNASANTGLVGYLMKRTAGWQKIICDHQFIHVRCAAHILNLIVNDGLKEASDSMDKIRNAVRYVRSSPSRLATFKACKEKNRIQSSQLLCLDVPTRWNSTYLMLSAAIKYKRAFESMEDDDLRYTLYFKEDDESDESKKGRTKRLGPPEPKDFEVAESLVEFLKFFYDATLKLSTSNHVSASTCFPEIAAIQNTLKMHTNSGDPLFSPMAKSMQLKFDKYWGKLSNANLLMYIAVILDPRRKLTYLRFCFKKLMDDASGDALLTLVQDALNKLYMWFVVNGVSSSNAMASGTGSSGLAAMELSDSGLGGDNLEAEFMRVLELETSAKGSLTELDQYLQDSCMVGNESFDILYWWKVNSCRYPVVAQVAQQILAVPMSTVASEACFSTGGRVLDVFRSSLSPTNVEALICCQNWLKGTAQRKEDKDKSEANDAGLGYIAIIEELGNELAAKVVID